MQKNIVRDQLILPPTITGAYVPEEIEGGSFYNHIINYVRRNTYEHGDWLWLQNRLTKESIMASEFEKFSKKFAVIFQELGLGKDDTIHLAVGNHNLAYSALGGVWILGGIGSCGDIALDAKSIAGQLKDSNAKLVLCIKDTAAKVKKAVASIEESSKKKIRIFSLGPSDGVEDIVAKLEDINEREAPEPVAVSNTKKDTCLIFWSSGTTGLPKGICHSHYSAFNFPGFMSSLLTPNTPAVSTTCFFHVGGFFTGILAIVKRQTYYHMFGKGFSLQTLLNTLTEIKPSAVAMGTHHYVQLAESDELQLVDPEDLESVKLLLPAGAAVPSSCELAIKAKMKNLEGVLNSYGQTESGVITCGTSPLHLGTVLPTVKVKIEDPDTGKRCKPNQLGEICVKSPYLMQKYLQRPRETEEYFDFEGFGHTGDLGYYDNEGNIFFVDRIKELIKYNNNHVAPTEIEDILQRHEGVQECLVFGKKDPKVQELISAVVIRKPKSKVTQDELVAFVNDQVIDYKKIRGGIIFRDEIPRNNVGKLVRRQMRDWAEHLV